MMHLKIYFILSLRLYTQRYLSSTLELRIRELVNFYSLGLGGSSPANGGISSALSAEALCVGGSFFVLKIF